MIGVVVGGLAATTGCMRPTPSPADQLEKALLGFHGHLVFARYDQAAGFVPSETRDAFLDYYEDQRGEFHLTEYEILRLEMSQDEHQAKAHVQLSWYRLPSTTVHTTKMEETWHFDPEAMRWEVSEQKVLGDDAN